MATAKVRRKISLAIGAPMGERPTTGASSTQTTRKKATRPEMLQRERLETLGGQRRHTASLPREA